MGQIMTLLDAVRGLDSFDEDTTIYAIQPWTPSSDVTIGGAPESTGRPVEASALGMTYFLEVFVAKEFLEDWTSSLKEPPSLAQKCERLIQYAIDDA